MGVIFVVSSDYLSAVMQEFKKYHFQLQGYGTFHMASQGILRTNTVDILGIAILADRLPVKGSAEFNDMLEFLYRCDLIGTNKKVLFLVKEDVGSILPNLQVLKHLRFYSAGKFDMVTDTLIQKNLFGSILLDCEDAYYFQEKPSIHLGNFTGETLSYVPILSKQLLSCIANFETLGSAKHTLEYDRYYTDFRKRKSNLALWRALYIKRCFGEEASYENSAIQTILEEELHNSKSSWSLLYVMYHRILRTPSSCLTGKECS